MKKAFTLVELLVVVAMIAILIGVVGGGYARAQARARIARAEAESNEMTNAIKAYLNYVDTGLKEMDEVIADESNLDFILGNGGSDRAGNPIPVLYNAAITGGRIMDPWGRPYRVTIRKFSVGEDGDPVGTGLNTGVFLPNRYGRKAGGQR